MNFLDWLDGEPRTPEAEALVLDGHPWIPQAKPDLTLSHPGTEHWFQGPTPDREKEAGG